jgi:hypothetical protein
LHCFSSTRNTIFAIPASRRGRVRVACRWLAMRAPLALAACQHQTSHLPGTP